MHEKKRTILNEAIKLFAKKGFDATTIQEIADESGISKGAFYLHFRSKEELVLSIFQYSSERIQSRMSAIEAEYAERTPREKFIRQLEAQFLELLAQKEVLILQFREQVLYMNKDIEQFFRNRQLERDEWLEASFVNMYGERIQPYIYDVSRLFDGLVNTYLKLMIVKNIHLDVTQLAPYIVRRLDDIVAGMMHRGEVPLLTKDILTSSSQAQDLLKHRITDLLSQMETEINKLTLDDEDKVELQNTLKFLLQEIKKDGDPETFIFKGLLANFDGIEELQTYRNRIAKKIGIHTKGED